MKTRILLSALLGLSFALPLNAAAEPASPEETTAFIGTWSIAWPDESGVIVNVPDATCDAPAVIERVDEDTIHVATPGGDMGNWDVRSFDGRFPWWREDGQSLVSEWKGEDAFLLAGKDRTGIMSDWDNAKQWTRCPADETESQQD